MAVVLCTLCACETRTTFTELGSVTERTVATLAVDLDGQQVRPTATDTEATAHATLRFTELAAGGIGGGSTILYMMHYDVSATGIDSVTSVHLHGPAGADEVGETLAVLFEATPGTGPIDGQLALDSIPYSYGFEFDDERIAEGATVGQIFQLRSQGLVYLDVHTKAHPDGEVRGNIP